MHISLHISFKSISIWISKCLIYWNANIEACHTSHKNREHEHGRSLTGLCLFYGNVVICVAGQAARRRQWLATPSRPCPRGSRCCRPRRTSARGTGSGTASTAAQAATVPVAPSPRTATPRTAARMTSTAMASRPTGRPLDLDARIA